MEIRTIRSGDRPGYGEYRCSKCGSIVTIGEEGFLPVCPRCQNTFFSVF